MRVAPPVARCGPTLDCASRTQRATASLLRAKPSALPEIVVASSSGRVKAKRKKDPRPAGQPNTSITQLAAPADVAPNDTLPVIPGPSNLDFDITFNNFDFDQMFPDHRRAPPLETAEQAGFTDFCKMFSGPAADQAALMPRDSEYMHWYPQVPPVVGPDLGGLADAVVLPPELEPLYAPRFIPASSPTQFQEALQLPPAMQSPIRPWRRSRHGHRR
ncbi:hypothetical protein GGX14DRAFT_562607 [Mycena pura]|uniref:Uncharacterized protein n=1 Tax=Mycena pura TaxID=153505 RepID=A0AAD6VNF2_9AGAR|nr:hypothetical protein GGX14DRAFT_562607 [Mycena pura]